MKRKTIDLGMRLHLDIEDDSKLDLAELIFKATEGEGDIRYGVNMNANIGWYASQKIQENLLNRGISKDQISVIGNSMHIKVISDKI